MISKLASACILLAGCNAQAGYGTNNAGAAGYGGPQFDPTAQAVTQPGQQHTVQYQPPNVQPDNGVSAALGGGAPQQPQTFDPNQNPMEALLGGINTGDGTNQFGENHGLADFSKAPTGAELSEDGQEVVEGLIEAYMHKVAMDWREKRCLQNNIGALTGDMIGSVADAAMAIKALVVGHGKIQGNDQGGVVSAGIDSAMKITSLIASSTQLVKGCVHGDALEMLKESAQHMINGTYLEHRFLVNGVDIAHELADAVIAFEHKYWKQFGRDLGTALRKTLFSTSTSAKRMPEGVPTDVIIEKVSEGLMKGFFVRGAAVDVTNVADPNLHMHIDLHRCIAGNSDFFKEVWGGLWAMTASLSANGMNGVKAAFTPHPNGQGQPKWMGDFMVAAMQVPMALSRCGINAADQQMLMKGIKSLGSTQMHVHFPTGHKIEAVEGTDLMAQAVEAWTNWNFEKFGYELGKMFRELMMLSPALQQQYEVHKIYGLRPVDQIQQRTYAHASVIVAGAAMTTLVALAVVRTRRSAASSLDDRMVQMTDLEDCEEAADSVE